MQKLKPCPERDIEESEELLGQELFLYEPADGVVHCLNNGAAIIWFLCDGTRDVESIAGEIASTYDLPEQDVLIHVGEAVGQFQSLGLLDLQKWDAPGAHHTYG